jgi:NADPH:quinone reductase
MSFDKLRELLLFCWRNREEWCKRTEGDKGEKVLIFRYFCNFNTSKCEVLQGSLKALAPFGRFIYYGSASAATDEWDSIHLVGLMSNQAVVGFNIAHTLTTYPEKAINAITHMLQLMATGNLNPVVRDIFPLRKASEAHWLIENRQTMGTVVLQP